MHAFAQKPCIESTFGMTMHHASAKSPRCGRHRGRCGAFGSDRRAHGTGSRTSAACPGGRRPRRRADPHRRSAARPAGRTRRAVDRRHAPPDVRAGRRTRGGDLRAVRRGRDVLRPDRLRCVAGEGHFTRASEASWPNSSGCCGSSTGWRPRSRRRRPGWHRAPPSGTPSRPAPGTTARHFHRSPAPCWRSARSGSSRCPPSRCPSCICCSPSRPVA